MTDNLSYSECVFLINSNFYPLIKLLSNFNDFEKSFFSSLYANQRSEDYFFIDNFTDLSFIINTIDHKSNKAEIIYKNRNDELIIHKTQEVDLRKECLNEMNIKYSVNEHNIKRKTRLYYEIDILLKNTEDKIYVLFTFSFKSNNEIQIKSPFNSKMKKSLNEFLCSYSKDFKFKGNSGIFISIVIPENKLTVFKEVTNLENCKYPSGSGDDVIDLSLDDGSKVITKKGNYLSVSWKDIKSRFFIKDFKLSDESGEDCFYIKSLIYSNIKRTSFETIFLTKEISLSKSLLIVRYDYNGVMSKLLLDQQILKMKHFLMAIKELASGVSQS